MPQSEDARLADLEARLERQDPGFVRAMRSGRPARPREHRRTGAWWGLALGFAVLGSGIALAQGLLIAAGLVLVGIAAQGVDPDPSRLGRQGPRRR
ncbi:MULTISPECIES: DUF3040 domain-containing protein [unclassified Streptomyces]|uniref:DUF3040 domain-containing protein n=1 Tax=unclassified Streptomyces TaxID=2593676 RepID=UPI0004BF8E5E|nr:MULTISPECIES: DUF3040 domain-containing protein [unclassified Streptomyces]